MSRMANPPEHINYCHGGWATLPSDEPQYFMTPDRKKVYKRERLDNGQYGSWFLTSEPFPTDVDKAEGLYLV